MVLPWLWWAISRRSFYSAGNGGAYGTYCQQAAGYSKPDRSFLRFA